MIPERFNGYACGDYFNSETFTRGVWDQWGQLWVIVPAHEVSERQELEFLVIGTPGADGMDFGYQNGHDGLWVYYPITCEFMPVAPNVRALADGWLDGSIKV
jgi:hypothetical protein